VAPKGLPNFSALRETLRHPWAIDNGSMSFGRPGSPNKLGGVGKLTAHVGTAFFAGANPPLNCCEVAMR
jgi:hypothetical protein